MTDSFGGGLTTEEANAVFTLTVGTLRRLEAQAKKDGMPATVAAANACLKDFQALADAIIDDSVRKMMAKKGSHRQ